jgi:YidC/Oxa1 family membrane protein insertase
VKEDQKNLILFVVIAALILFGSQFLTSKFLPPANPPVTKIVGGKTQVLPAPTSAPTTPTAGTTGAVRDRKIVLAESPRVSIQTPALNGSINLKGARIDDLVLSTYKETIDKNSPPITLLSPAGTAKSYFAGFGWAGDNVAAPDKNTLWTADKPVLTPGSPVTLTWQNARRGLPDHRSGRRALHVLGHAARRQSRRRARLRSILRLRLAARRHPGCRYLDQSYRPDRRIR